MYLSFSHLFLFINSIESTFVSIGKYPDLISKGVNTPECGLRYKPRIYELVFIDKCFTKNSNKTFWDSMIPNNREVSSRVFNGQPAEYGESPWTVFINHGWSGSDCTGVLVALNWVLTAAHCYNDKKTFINGGSNEKKGRQVITVETKSWFIHPNYSADGNQSIVFPYDIALIKLDKSFSHFTEHNNYLINTICLPEVDQYNTVEEDSTFFGHGITSYDESRWLGKDVESERLIKAKFELRPMSVCWDGRVFCARRQGDQPAICSGDSGGGLVQYKGPKAILIGIARGGYPQGSKCSSAIRYNSFIPVPRDIAWIIKTIGDN